MDPSQALREPSFLVLATPSMALCNAAVLEGQWMSLDFRTLRQAGPPSLVVWRATYGTSLLALVLLGIPKGMGKWPSAADTGSSMSTPTATRATRSRWKERHLSC